MINLILPKSIVPCWVQFCYLYYLLRNRKQNNYDQEHFYVES